MEPTRTSYFGLDAVLFGRFIEFTETLTRLERLMLALFLVMDVLVTEQETALRSSAFMPFFSRTITF